MIRKLTLLLLLSVGLTAAVKAQSVDSVSIAMPYGTDTTCPGIQLTFIATTSNDSFSYTRFHWYTDNIYTTVSLVDTFYSTALVDGDSVF